MNGQKLYVDVGPIHSGTRFGQGADVAGIHAVAVHQAQHFHAGLGRKVRDESGVQHIAVDAEGLVGFHGRHDAAGILVGTGVGQVLVRHQFIPSLSPVLDLADAASRVLVEGDVVAFDKLGVVLLDPVGHVLGGVL